MPLRAFPRSNAIRVGVSPRFPGPILGTPGHPLNPVLPGDWVVNGNPAMITQVDAENLLKAADALDNESYWVQDEVVPSDQGSGVWRLTKGTAAAFKDVSQLLTNWFPEWAGTVSMFLEIRAGTLDNARFGLRVNGVDSVDDIEIISGNGTKSIANDMGKIVGLDSGWTSIRVSAPFTGWSASAHAIIFVDGDNSNTGYLEVRNLQVVLGSTAKPRPVNAGVEDWMMAYRPHNRLTGDEQGRFYVNDSEGKVWLGLEADVLAPPTTGAVDGIHLAGGASSLAYGNPGVWLTQPDGAAFDVGCGSAVVFRAKTLAAARVARLGFGGAADGLATQPCLYLSGDTLSARNTSGSAETNQPWPAGTALSFLQLLRSDTHGSQFLLHDSGKQWKRFNVNDEVIPAASAYPVVSNLNAELYVTGFGLMDLKANHEPEWVEVTDTKTAPASGYYDMNPNCEVDFSLSPESGFYAYFYFRGVGNNDSFRFGISSGTVSVRNSVDGVHQNFSGGSSLVIGQLYNFKVTLHGSDFKIFQDGVLRSSGTFTNPGNNETAGGNINTTLVTNDIEITTHPYPALGGALGATDRVVAPQDGDAFEAPTDLMTILRNVTLGDGSISVHARNSVVDSVDGNLYSDGSFVVWEGASQRIFIAASTFTDGNDVQQVFFGNAFEVFGDGASKGQASNLVNVTGVDGYYGNNSNGSADGLELWPLFVELVDPTL